MYYLLFFSRDKGSGEQVVSLVVSDTPTLFRDTYLVTLQHKTTMKLSLALRSSHRDFILC